MQPPVTSSLFGPNILLNTLFSNTWSICSSLNVRDQVSHPYRTTCKIIVLFILIFMFLESRREDKKVLGWMVASITGVTWKPVLHLTINVIFPEEHCLLEYNAV
jgi:TctA family transporter